LTWKIDVHAPSADMFDKGSIISFLKFTIGFNGYILKLNVVFN